MAYVATYRLSLCQCCMLVLANGECCDQDHGTEHYPEPLVIIPATDNVTLGLLQDEHAEACEFKATGVYAAGYECDCEKLGFSWAACDGCGSRMGGDRYGATGWTNDKVAV